MRLKQALDEKKFDVRLRDKLLAEGKISHDELVNYQKSLEDSVDSMTYTETEEEKAEEQQPEQE